jgi:hypothetical protein
VFGSFATRLCLPHSDVDLVIFNTPEDVSTHLTQYCSAVYYLVFGFKSSFRSLLSDSHFNILPLLVAGVYTNGERSTCIGRRDAKVGARVGIEAVVLHRNTATKRQHSNNQGLLFLSLSLLLLLLLLLLL